MPSLCNLWPANITDLPGDAAGGQLAYYYGSRLIDPVARNMSRPADGMTLLGTLGNLTRLVIDAGGCNEGYEGRLCAMCTGPAYYRALDGTCSPCPKWGNFLTYLIWFGVFGMAAVGIVYAATSRVYFYFMLLSAVQVSTFEGVVLLVLLLLLKTTRYRLPKAHTREF